LGAIRDSDNYRIIWGEGTWGGNTNRKRKRGRDTAVGGVCKTANYRWSVEPGRDR
jgi:hypothetical protein